MSIFFGQNNPLFLFVLDEALVICRENIHIHMIIIVMTKAVSNRDICFIKAVLLRTRALFTCICVALLKKKDY